MKRFSTLMLLLLSLNPTALALTAQSDDRAVIDMELISIKDNVMHFDTTGYADRDPSCCPRSKAQPASSSPQQTDRAASQVKIYAVSRLENLRATFCDSTGNQDTHFGLDG